MQELPDKKAKVTLMFDDISPKYDFLNHFLSMGIDRSWRRKLTEMLRPNKPRRILDVACGTGDLAFALMALEPEKITGIDLSEKMLEIGRVKITQAGLEEKILFRTGDAEKIPFSDNSFDAVTVAFGVRNFTDLDKGLAEMRRVIKPGGVVAILEFSHPDKFPVKQFYTLYSKYVIPFWGRTISRNKEAYRYLPETVAAFPSGNSFLRIMERAGMKNSRLKKLSSGIATIYLGEK
jgi:demethylmenaquinone methyltransferase / 2-methoxy-6-polyprenyl-1,4-benzoquinol methylase